MTGESEVPSAGRLALLITLAVLVPTVGLSIYLGISHRSAAPSVTSDYLALGISVLVGLLCVWRLPIKPRARLLWCAALLGPLVLWLMFYGFAFLCAVFHDCN